MFLNQVFELSVVLNEKKFYEILSKAKFHEWDEDKEEYTDNSLADKGIIIRYRDSQYKKKVIIEYHVNDKQEDGTLKIEKIVSKLEKYIRSYFRNKYSLEDFKLARVVISHDINMERKKLVGEYLKVLRRIGNVKKFTVSEMEGMDKSTYFCLRGNSNGLQFMAYHLESVVKEQSQSWDIDKKQVKSVLKDVQGVLRMEVCLEKLKAIYNNIEETSVTTDIVKEVLKERRRIFMDVLYQIIPYGNYYKKDKAMEIIHKEVDDKVLRRKMMRLVTLIPEKKSLHLAQKSMNCKRDMDKIMKEFAKINLSPVTLSKRQRIKFLENIYKCMG